jgi:hypothetical protein
LTENQPLTYLFHWGVVKGGAAGYLKRQRIGDDMRPKGQGIDPKERLKIITFEKNIDMKYYWIKINGEKNGPWTKEELIEKRVLKGTLTWTEGMENWDVIEKIQELKDIAISIPPPTPEEVSKTEEKKEESKTIIEKSDIIQGNTGEGWVGVVLIIAQFIIYAFMSGRKYDDVSDYENAKMTAAIVAIVYRIFITIWVVDIAGKRNREQSGWGFFAFFLPNIALIIIGFSKKIKLNVKIDNNLDINWQIEDILRKADKFYENDRYDDLIQCCNTIIETEKENYTISTSS